MAGTRLSGMISGMDTESLISQLMEAKKTKVTKVKKQQMKHNVKQDAWKDLNTKLKNLQSKYVSNMRFTSSYAKKTTKVSDSSVASVITGENAVNGVQELEVLDMAKTAYLTGGEVTNATGAKGSFNALTTMSDLGFTGGGSFAVKIGDKEENFSFDAGTSISDFLSYLKDRGLNASFDEKNQRMFISAKSSGAKNDFSIKANDENSAKALSALGLMTEEEKTAANKEYNITLAGKTGNKVPGQDAMIKLNGATFTSNTNTFEINGLTITANSKTTSGPVTLSTQTDTDGIYDMVKSFLKEYNAVVKEMDKLYNAASAKGYEPLTSEEKDAMSDTEVEEWEKKIKDSILRNDDNLGTLSTGIRGVMSAGVSVGGKTMYLSDFGINTLGYFEAADNEKNVYHIDGDPDDENSSGNADKLKSMIASDPDTVIKFFSGLSQNLYSKMSDLSKSVDGYRSFGSFFDDKKMKTDYESYTSKISDMEQKLNDYEDKWYKKFAKMESAMAKMQSKTNALGGLIGGNY
ncbi:MAG: flagellar filament capping protein FliD [Lachnospiraceae bacterium]|nr:flagellar filament capping protein FliD [Lachnospiraceae bacterium]